MYFLSFFTKSEPKQERRTSLPPPPIEFTRRITSLDPCLYAAHTEIININNSTRNNEVLEPQQQLKSTEWYFYRQNITSLFIKEILSTTTKKRLSQIKFSKCKFEPGAFSFLIQTLSEQDEDILRTIDVCFDGYLHEAEKNDHVHPTLPFSDIVKVVADSTCCVHRFSFQRCYLPQYKLITLIRAFNDRKTNHHQECCIHGILQLEMENLINRDPILYQELLGVISNVPWIPHLHTSSDIPFIELQTESEYFRYFSLDKFYNDQQEQTGSQVAVRRPKMDLEVRFVYFSESIWKFPAKPSCDTNKDFSKEINTVMKQLHKEYTSTTQ